MAITITPGFTWTNGATVMPTRLNSSQSGLKISCAADSLLGRSTGSGEIQEIACTAAGRALLDDVDATAQRATLGLAPTSRVQLGALEANPSAITSASSIALDLTDRDTQQCDLAHNPTITTTNRASGRGKRVRLVAGASTRTLTFSEAWVWLNIAAAPTTLPANKTAELIVFCYGSNATDVVAYWAVQA